MAIEPTRQLIDQRTRISLFAVNVELGANETLSVITAQAEDSLGQIFPLTVEHFGSTPNFNWLKQVIVKLPDEIANTVWFLLTPLSSYITGEVIVVGGGRSLS